MTVGFYFDEHLPRAVANGLLERGYEVVMTADVGMRSKDDDSEILPYAAEHHLVVVTFDRPFAGRTMQRTDHAGLICPPEDMRTDIGGLIRLLVEFAEAHSPEDVEGQVFWLKL
jgi:Domain of unknown function (DUF5615)